MLVPTSKGISADQFSVPAAVPDATFQFTTATPTLSPAVPVTRIEAAEVATMLKAGDPMRRVGGTWSLWGGLGETGAFGGAGAGAGAGGGGGAAPELPYRSRIPAMSSSLRPASCR